MADRSAQEKTGRETIQTLKLLGENPLPPTILATLVTAQSLRPFQPLPMLFPPVLLFSTYLNLGGLKVDSAGITASWSALYLLLASRRKQTLRSKFGARGIVRGGTIGMCLFNIATGGVAYALGEKKEKASKRDT
ncbi:MAG: hypothetical protein M1820_000364 [Bogoriella megaspora]|nr:MAG: hypothetical protein M1820_000364 [Bogoriella megaspora]